MCNKNFDIDIPFEKLDKAINNGIERAERYSKKKVIKRVVAACAIFTTISVVNFAEPALAENIPVVGNVFESLNNSLGIKNDYTKYTQGINKEQINADVNIKIDEAICTDENLVISLVIKNDKGFKVPEDFPVTQFRLDGLARVNFMPYYDVSKSKIDSYTRFAKKIGADYKELFSSKGIKGKLIDENTFVGKIEYDLRDLGKAVPNAFKVKFNVEKLNMCYHSENDNDDDYNIKGNWNFEFDIDKSNSEEFKTIEVNKERDDFKVGSIRMLPFKATVKCIIPEKIKDRAVVLVDKNGEKIFSGAHRDIKNNEFLYEFDLNKKVEVAKVQLVDWTNSQVITEIVLE